MNEPQWPGDSGPTQQFPPIGRPAGRPYGPAPMGSPYGPAPMGSPYGPAPGHPYGPAPGYPYGPAPGYPYGPPPGQFGPWGYPPPAGPPPGRKNIWVLGGIALVVVVALVAAVLVWHFAGGSSDKTPRMSARELLVTQSDFPKLPPPVRFNATSGSQDEPDGGAVNVSPSECNDVLGHTDTTADTARAELSNAAARGDEGPRGYAVRVTKPVGAHYLDNFEAGLDKCQKVTIDREGVKVDGTVKRLSVSATPVPVVGAAARFTSTTYGVKVAMTMQVFVAVVRGTSVEVSANRMKINGGAGMDAPDDEAVSLVNKQVEKIQQAG